jgi:hypothetical protein
MPIDYLTLLTELTKKYGNDRGVFDISLANRFGSEKAIVGCVSKEDFLRLKPIISKEFNPDLLHYWTPIWFTGSLIPELGKKLEEMIRDARYMTGGTEEHAIYIAKRNLVIDEEEKLWNSWTETERLQFIRRWIIKQRKRIPGYANCGDKFFT